MAYNVHIETTSKLSIDVQKVTLSANEMDNMEEVILARGVLWFNSDIDGLIYINMQHVISIRFMPLVTT